MDDHGLRRRDRDDALGHRELAHGDRLLEAVEFDADGFRNVPDRAFDFDLGVIVHDDGARELGVLDLADEVEMDADRHLLVEVHPGEVDVDHVVPEIAELQVLHEAGLGGGTVDRHVEDVLAVVEVGERRLLLDAHRDGVGAVAVDDRGKLAGFAKSLGVATSESLPRGGVDGRGFMSHA